MRILFISGEVAPFSEKSELASVVRSLPESLHESGKFETRIMMPRYGTVSERRNRLHEVIRLSGSEIMLGDRTETLRVKVASIPGIRLQVYFMDNDFYFKRKGIFADKQGKLFEDNLERSAFYARSVIRTIRNLGWQPDLILPLAGSLDWFPTYCGPSSEKMSFSRMPRSFTRQTALISKPG